MHLHLLVGILEEFSQLLLQSHLFTLLSLSACLWALTVGSRVSLGQLKVVSKPYCCLKGSALWMVSITEDREEIKNYSAEHSLQKRVRPTLRVYFSLMHPFCALRQRSLKMFFARGPGHSSESLPLERDKQHRGEKSKKGKRNLSADS